jgi:hypothetical protein
MTWVETLGGKGKQLRADFQKVSFDLGILKPIERPPTGHYQIKSVGDERLMVPKNFAKPSFCPISHHRVTHSRTGSDKANPRSRCNRTAAFVGSGARRDPQNKTAAMVAAAMGSHLGEVCRPSQVRFGSEAHDMSAVKQNAERRLVRRRTSACGPCGGER